MKQENQTNEEVKIKEQFDDLKRQIEVKEQKKQDREMQRQVMRQKQKGHPAAQNMGASDLVDNNDFYSKRQARLEEQEKERHLAKQLVQKLKREKLERRKKQFDMVKKRDEVYMREMEGIVADRKKREETKQNALDKKRELINHKIERSYKKRQNNKQ